MRKEHWDYASEEFKLIAVQGMKQMVALLDVEALAKAVKRNPFAFVHSSVDYRGVASAKHEFHSAWHFLLDNAGPEFARKIAEEVVLGAEHWRLLAESRELLSVSSSAARTWNAFLDGIEANPRVGDGMSLEILARSIASTTQRVARLDGDSVAIGDDSLHAKRWSLAWRKAFDEIPSSTTPLALSEMWSLALCKKMIQKEWSGALFLMSMAGFDCEGELVLPRTAMGRALSLYVDAVAGGQRRGPINLAAANVMATAAAKAPPILAAAIMACHLLDSRAVAVIEKKLLRASTAVEPSSEPRPRRSMSL